MKKILALLLAITSPFLFAACGSGISGKEAKACADEFFNYISEEKYTEAQALFHPDIVIDGHLENLFLHIKDSTGADIKNGFSVKYTGFQSSLYDTEYGGSHYALDGIIEIDGQPFELEIEFIKRNEAFGIYNFDIDID